ncbi:MAG: flagellar filament capping protein FliD, partial [Candidatus Zixiibacteriota bacterium]
ASLNGGKALNFTGSSFDQVEKSSFSTGATSNPTLGTTAAYSGNKNKVYTFTVGGTGTQTVGSGDITLNWSDGINTGSILVSSADTEVELTGAGSDGLKLRFAAGQLVSGDTFRVQTFAPLLQNAQDAEITVGSTDGGGSPITIKSESNIVKNVIGGLTLNLKKKSDDVAVNILVERDTSKIEDSVNTFIDKFNDVLGAIDEQFKHDPEASEDTGILFGDRTLLMLQDSMRSKITSRVGGLESDYNMLASIGIRIGSTGKLAVVDRAKLQDAITNNIDDVQKLFAASGDSSNAKVSFVSMGNKTKTSEDGYSVNITQAAAKGYMRGASVADPEATPIVITSANKNMAFRVDGVLSDTITLSEKTYSSWNEVVTEVQQKINTDSKIGKMGVEVGSFDNGEDGYLTLTSGTYGKNSKIELQTSVNSSAFTALGLAMAQSFEGRDVAGTINGEKATGSGRVLTGNDGNATTAGLKLMVELADREVGSEVDATIKVSRGIASLAQDFSDSITKSVDGTLARRTKALENQIKDIEERVTDMNQRMEIKRQRLLEKFLDMESLIGQLNQESSYLAAQLNQISENFSQIVSNNGG